jgi:hypothetical protein
MLGSRQAWHWSSSWGLYILICRQQAEREALGIDYASEISKPTPQWHTSNKAIPPNPFQTVPLTVDYSHSNHHTIQL